MPRDNEAVIAEAEAARNELVRRADQAEGRAKRYLKTIIGISK